MKTIFSVVMTFLFFTSAQAADIAMSSKEELLNTYNISIVSDSCLEDGYGINHAYPCVRDETVETVAADVLQKLQALKAHSVETVVELRVYRAWMFCINSNDVLPVTENNGLVAYRVQECNMDKTLQQLPYAIAPTVF